MKTKTVKITGYVIHDAEKLDAEIYPKGPFSFSMYKPSLGYSPRCTIVQEHTFEVKIPADYDPRANLVSNLQAQKEKARADFAALVVSLDRQINELLAIEG